MNSFVYLVGTGNNFDREGKIAALRVGRSFCFEG